MIWNEEREVWVGPDPLYDRDPDDGEIAMSMFDPELGWVDASPKGTQ